MRVEAALSKMESNAPAAKLSLDQSNVDMEDAHDLAVVSSASSPDGYDSADARPTARVTGKRSSRDEPVESTSGKRAMGSRGFDMAKASKLGRELLERKRLMLDQVTLSSSLLRGDGELTPLSRLAEVKVSDDDSDDNPKLSKTANRNLTSLSSTTDDLPVKSEPLSEEDIQRRKAQRRREQVRAASRRCRDRQRRETEELRMKVFQLEDFISHTMQSYESELRRQRHQLDAAQREIETLRSTLAAQSPVRAHHASSVVSSPMSVGSSSTSRNAKSASSVAGSPGSWTDHASLVGTDDIIWDTARIQNMQSTTESCKRAILQILDSGMAPAFQHHAFGWSFDFWAHDPQYFVRSYKFFRGMRAHDVADRNFDVDYVKYLETFPEIKEKEVLQWPSPNVHIVQTVKDFPGRGAVSSLSAKFISRDDHFAGAGERWIVGTISVGSANTLKFSHEDDCNGYIFEDAVEVASDGREIHGCMVRGIGRYEGKGQEMNALMEELAKIFASVVLRWEGLFINDYMEEADQAVDDLDGLDF